MGHSAQALVEAKAGRGRKASDHLYIGLEGREESQMKDDLSVSLHELRNSTNKLNTLTDRANGLIQRTEYYLSKECRIGGPVNVHIEALDKLDHNDNPNLPEWTSYLGYERHNGEHRIMVTHVLDGDPHESKPWAECSRDIKLKAIEALPSLIEKMLEKVQNQVVELEGRLDRLDRIIPLKSASSSALLDKDEKA